MYDLLSELDNPAIRDNLLQADEALNRIILMIQGLFFGIDCKAFANFRLTNITLNENGYTFFWHSISESSTCPRCGTESNSKRGFSRERKVVGEAILGKAVMHKLKKRIFICKTCKSQGNPASFTEDTSEICGPRRKTTRGLDEKIINDGIRRSANGLAQDYLGEIDVSRETILNRVKEGGALVTEKNLTDTDHVKILSVDDNNGRKGNSSTASTVIIDAESHLILAVAEGATSKTAEQLFKRFPQAQGLSRDRAGAYTKAGNDCNLEQYADVFHLITNAQEAVKEALSKELPYHIYVREGDGWVEIPTPSGTITGTETVEDPVFITTLSEEDIAMRVKLAHLSPKQEEKYRMAIELLQLYDQELRTKAILKRMDLTSKKHASLMRNVADVINGVEEKIDRYQEDVSMPLQQKSLNKNAKPSHKSIVAPYGDTIMRMVEEGHAPRTIYPVIKEMGFGGCQGTIYHYIAKRRHEDLGVEDSKELTEDIPADISIQRPPRVSMQRTTKTDVYKCVLHEASKERKRQNGCSIEATIPTLVELPNDTASAEIPPQKKQKSFYSDEIANIIRGKGREKRKERRKKEKIDLKECMEKHPVIGDSIDFLADMYQTFDGGSVLLLDECINKYENSEYEPFARYVNGLKDDYEAVKNAILNRHISNGPIEGVNNKIKLLRRIRYGRAGADLLNAICVLSSIPRFTYSAYNILAEA